MVIKSARFLNPFAPKELHQFLDRLLNGINVKIMFELLYKIPRCFSDGAQFIVLYLGGFPTFDSPGPSCSKGE